MSYYLIESLPVEVEARFPICSGIEQHCVSCFPHFHTRLAVLTGHIIKVMSYRYRCTEFHFQIFICSSSKEGRIRTKLLYIYIYYVIIYLSYIYLSILELDVSKKKNNWHSQVTSQSAVACEAEILKCTKYNHLAAIYNFLPVAVETLGSLEESANNFIRVLGKKITAVTGEKRATHFLHQCQCGHPTQKCC